MCPRCRAAKLHLAESAAAKERLAALLANRPRGQGIGRSTGSSTGTRTDLSSSTLVCERVPPPGLPGSPGSPGSPASPGSGERQEERQRQGPRRPSAAAVLEQQEWLRDAVARSMEPTAKPATAAKALPVGSDVGRAPAPRPPPPLPGAAVPSKFMGLEGKAHQGLEVARAAGEKLLKDIEKVVLPCISPRGAGAKQRFVGERQRAAPPAPPAPPAPSAPPVPATPIAAA